MKYKQISLLLFIMLIGFVSSETIGDNYKVNESMQITNYCGEGVCTYITLMSVEYPNGSIIYPITNMTKTGQTYNFTFIPDIIGTYYFITCGDASVNVCDRDEFTTNYDGEPNHVAVHILLIAFFVLLFFGFYSLNQRTDFEAWYNKLSKRYENKDFFKAMGSGILYSLVKDLFMIYYFLGLFIMLVLADLIHSYNVVSLLNIFDNILLVYLWGITLIGLALLGRLQQLAVSLKDQATDLLWGLGNGK